MTPQQIHHACIMIECGCSIEDVAVTMRVQLHDAIYAVAPALKSNPEERRRVNKMLTRAKLPVPVIPTLHRQSRVAAPRLDVVKSAPRMTRKAA